MQFNQTIHGYSNGHQLLMSSVQLSPQISKTLLYQSDLSGSNIDNNFKEYITGFPIKSIKTYAFSKTWYANEMSRPGCVWTHTILIPFEDLGFIVNTANLLTYFKRPKIDEYEAYSKKIDFLNQEPNLIYEKETMFYGDIVKALYSSPKDTIVIPSHSSEIFEQEFLKIWSDQWPRLRRNFSFCTGSLSIRSVNNKEFDLQVVPISNINNIVRRSQNITILNLSNSNNRADIDDKKFKNSRFKHFISHYEKEIPGLRRNYLVLWEIFNLIQLRQIDLELVSNHFLKYFYSPSSLLELKRDIYGESSILQIEEKILLQHLTTFHNIQFIDIDINQRIKTALRKKTITIDDFLTIWQTAVSDRISENILNEIELDYTELFNSYNGNFKVRELLLKNAPQLFLNESLWKTDLNNQREILLANYYYNKEINWQLLINSILENNSPIIFEAYKLAPKQAVGQTLNWINSYATNKKIRPDWAIFLAKNHYYEIQDWFINNYKSTTPKFYSFIASYLPCIEFINLNLPYNVFEQTLKQNIQGPEATNTYFIICILSIGFRNKVPHSHKLVEQSFSHAYKLAKEKRINSELWSIIPKEDYEKNTHNPTTPLDFIISLLSAPIEKSNRINNYDYCEILIVTVVNKFVKYNWPTSSFLNSLNNDILFNRAIKYIITFKNGINYLDKVILDIKTGKSNALSFQKNILL